MHNRRAYIVQVGTFGWVMVTAGAMVVGLSAAHARPSGAPEGGVPDSGFYAGLGVNANLVVPTRQAMYSQGVSQVFQGGAPAAQGAAGGPSNPDMPVGGSISPSAQLGYFQRLPESRWLLGSEFSYNDMNATSTGKFTLAPQRESFTQSNGVTTPFTGNVAMRSYQVTADHQFALLPYVGYTFDKSYVYLGAGPSLARVEAKMNNTVGFASINGVTNSITGSPTNYSNAQWLLGVLSGTYSGAVNTHSILVSVNRRF